MLAKIITDQLLVDLLDEQQELFIGGNNPQVSNNNFVQRLANTTGTNFAGPTGNSSQINTIMADVNSSSRSMLSSGSGEMMSPFGLNMMTPNPLFLS
jgi:hypothetical protein